MEAGVGFLFEFVCEVEVVGEAGCHHGCEHEDAGFAKGGFVVREGYGVDKGGGDVGDGGLCCACVRGKGAAEDSVCGEGGGLEAEAVGRECGGAVGEGEGGGDGGPAPAGVVQAYGDGVLGEHFAGGVLI